MSTHVRCQEVRASLYELRRGDLSELERTEIEAHLQQCSSCRALVAKTVDMLDTAADGDAQLWTHITADSLFTDISASITEGLDAEESLEQARLGEAFEAARQESGHFDGGLDADALFARIASEIDDTPAAKPELSAAGNFEHREPEDSARLTSYLRAPRIGVAVAAAALIAVTAWWALSVEDSSSPQQAEQQALSERPDTPSGDGDDDPGPLSNHKEATAAVIETTPLWLEAMPALKSIDGSSRSLNLFASKEGDYELFDDDGHKRIELHTATCSSRCCRAPQRRSRCALHGKQSP